MQKILDFVFALSFPYIGPNKGIKGRDNVILLNKLSPDGIFLLSLPWIGLALIFEINLDRVAELPIYSKIMQLLLAFILLCSWIIIQSYRNRRLGNIEGSRAPHSLSGTEKIWSIFINHTITIFIVSGISYYSIKLFTDSSKGRDFSIFDIINSFDLWQIYLCVFILFVYIIIFFIYIKRKGLIDIILLWISSFFLRNFWIILISVFSPVEGELLIVMLTSSIFRTICINIYPPLGDLVSYFVSNPGMSFSFILSYIEENLLVKIINNFSLVYSYGQNHLLNGLSTIRVKFLDSIFSKFNFNNNQIFVRLKQNCFMFLGLLQKIHGYYLLYKPSGALHVSPDQGNSNIPIVTNEQWKNHCDQQETRWAEDDKYKGHEYKFKGINPIIEPKLSYTERTVLRLLEQKSHYGDLYALVSKGKEIYPVPFKSLWLKFDDLDPKGFIFPFAKDFKIPLFKISKPLGEVLPVLPPGFENNKFHVIIQFWHNSSSKTTTNASFMDKFQINYFIFSKEVDIDPIIVNNLDLNEKIPYRRISNTNGSSRYFPYNNIKPKMTQFFDYYHVIYYSMYNISLNLPVTSGFYLSEVGYKESCFRDSVIEVENCIIKNDIMYRYPKNKFSNYEYQTNTKADTKKLQALNGIDERGDLGIRIIQAYDVWDSPSVLDFRKLEYSSTIAQLHNGFKEGGSLTGSPKSSNYLADQIAKIRRER